MNGGREFRLGVLGSGKGSNFAAIADACIAGEVPALVGVVLSDVAEAGILENARQRGIPARHIPPGKFRTKLDEESERAYVEALHSSSVDLIVLAGFMRVLKGDFLRTFEGRIVNIHPSLLPAFPGAHAVADALAYGVAVTGCTVHLVDAGVDTGPIVAQEAVSVEPGEDVDALHERIKVVERRLLVDVIALLTRQGYTVHGRKVSIP